MIAAGAGGSRSADIADDGPGWRPGKPGWFALAFATERDFRLIYRARGIFFARSSLTSASGGNPPGHDRQVRTLAGPPFQL